MKVLSIKEPWASLIINGYKEYEFRSWKTNYRGKILIHTSLGEDTVHRDKFASYSLDCIHGAIIGEAVIVDCVLVTDELRLELQKRDPIVYSGCDTYGFQLANIKKYEEPIYVKGKLGLWNYEI